MIQPWIVKFDCVTPDLLLKLKVKM